MYEIIELLIKTLQYENITLENRAIDRVIHTLSALVKDIKELEELEQGEKL